MAFAYAVSLNLMEKAGKGEGRFNLRLSNLNHVKCEVLWRLRGGHDGGMGWWAAWAGGI